MTAAVNWIQREQDIGVNLNTALHTREPSRFRFLLAALSPHAPDWQEPRKKEPTTSWVAPFSVGVQRPLYASERDWLRQPTEIASQSFLDWFLQDCLDPEALVASSAEIKLPTVIKENSPHWLLARDNQRSDTVLEEADLVDMLDKLHSTA